MPSMPSLRNPFRKASHVAQVTANAPIESSKSLGRSNQSYSSTNPYLSLPLAPEFHSKDSVTLLKGTGEKAVSVIRGKADEFAGEYKLSGRFKRSLLKLFILYSYLI